MAQGVSNTAGHGQIQLRFFPVTDTRTDLDIQAVDEKSIHGGKV